MVSLARQMLSLRTLCAARRRAPIATKYINAEVYAITGASRAHGLITANLTAALRPLIRGSGCQLFASDMKVRLQVAGQEILYYPDLLLTCDPNDRATYYCVAPCLVVEVLSEGTARIDRCEKLLAYRSLPSLQEYWLVEQGEPRIERYRRLQAGRLRSWRAAAWV